MKKLFVGILMVMVMVGFGGVASAIDVGGVILNDTTWYLTGSPYKITTSIYVDTDVTLTIAPGVVINGGYGNPNDGDIIVYGSLDAIGNPAAKIIFNDVRIKSSVHDAFISIDNCEFYKGSPSSSQYSINSLRITNSYFRK